MMPHPSIPPETLAALKRDFLSSLHVALPGRVESFDPARATASIRPMLRSPSGLSLPLLSDVPVFLPLPSMMTVSPGDFCLVVFADSAIDGWLTTGEESPPSAARLHDLSDGFAFVGFRPVQWDGSSGATT